MTLLLLYLIVSQEVSRFKGEEQGHVVVFGECMFMMNIISVVLQQSAGLIHHPVWGMYCNGCVSRIILYMHCYVQLGFLPLCPLYILIFLFFKRLEYDEGDFLLVTADTVRQDKPVIIALGKEMVYEEIATRSKQKFLCLRHNCPFGWMQSVCR